MAVLLSSVEDAPTLLAWRVLLQTVIMNHGVVLQERLSVGKGDTLRLLLHSNLFSVFMLCKDQLIPLESTGHGDNLLQRACQDLFPV